MAQFALSSSQRHFFVPHGQATRLNPRFLWLCKPYGL